MGSFFYARGVCAEDKVRSWAAAFKVFLNAVIPASSEEEMVFRAEVSGLRFPDFSSVSGLTAKCRNLFEDEVWREVSGSFAKAFVGSVSSSMAKGWNVGVECEWRSAVAFLRYVLSVGQSELAVELGKRTLGRIRNMRKLFSAAGPFAGSRTAYDMAVSELASITGECVSEL